MLFFYLLFVVNSKSWNVLALDGSNWQKVDLFNFQTDIEGPVVENISLRCGGFLKELSLRGCKAVTDSALRTFAQNCNNIEDLNLNDCKYLTDRYVINCPYLFSAHLFLALLFWIDYIQCHEQSSILISSSSLPLLVQYLVNLHFILFSIFYSTCASLSKHCSKLTSLNIGSCIEITDRSLEALG